MDLQNPAGEHKITVTMYGLTNQSCILVQFNPPYYDFNFLGIGSHYFTFFFFLILKTKKYAILQPALGVIGEGGLLWALTTHTQNDAIKKKTCTKTQSCQYLLQNWKKKTVILSSRKLVAQNPSEN